MKSVDLVLKERLPRLVETERARLVFTHMREFLESRQNQRIVGVEDYRRQFENVEVAHQCLEVYLAVFYRGYTCGLWTTFHALTVHTYIDTIKDDRIDAIKPLKSIQVGPKFPFTLLWKYQTTQQTRQSSSVLLLSVVLLFTHFYFVLIPYIKN
uniref:Cullin domain-containing protein n=1 Tax=Heterorhabditis bacteriophora TaxID=37862 RepID=A0A1I7WWT4_HETBA